MPSVRVLIAYLAIAIYPLLLAGSSSAFAQETRASLGGKVTDSTGAIVPKAIVVVKADATGVVQTATTNNSGEWKIIGLLPGLYDFTVSATGFDSAEYISIDLQVSDQKSIDTHLKPGAQTASVVVESSVPLIDTTSAVSGTVLTSSEMEELPSLSNAPTMFIALTPGVTVTNGLAGSGIYAWSNTGLSEVASNGTGSTGASDFAAINYMYDGGENTNNQNSDRGAGQLAFSPPIDAVGQLRVVNNAYDASIGRTLGTTQLLTSKTGGRRFHGDLYEWNQNDFLNANTYANDANGLKITPIHSNFYGGTVSGPVWIPKLYDGGKKGTFFFFSYSGIRLTNPTNTGYTSVPNAAERNGDFSNSYTVNNGVKYPINIYDPNTIMPTNAAHTTFTRSQFPGNKIPSSRIDPIAKAYLQYVALPNAAPQLANGNDASNYLLNLTQTSKLDSAIVRLDHAWNNSNHSYISLRRNNWNSISKNTYGNQALELAVNPAQSRLNRQITVDHTLVLNSQTVLDLNYSLINYFGQNISSTSGQDPTTLGFSPAYARQMQVSGIPQIGGVSNLATLGTTYANNYSNDVNQDLRGSFTQTYRNHTFQYGAEYMIQQQGAGNLLGTAGGFTFGTNWTDQSPVGTQAIGSGSSLAEFLLGLPNGGSIPTTATGFWSQHFTAFYFQDNWRANKKLTFNIGLRWDYERPVTERFDRLASRFDPNYVVSGVSSSVQPNYAALVNGGTSGNTGLALLQQERPSASSFIARGGILYAGLNGTSRYVVNPRYKYFQPRLGFAYHVFENTVIRGGLGRFVQADFITGAQTAYSQTTSLVASTDNYQSAPTVSLADPYPNGLAPVTGNSQGPLTNVGSIGSFTDPDIGRIYADTASASVQQQVGRFLFDTTFILTEAHGLPMAWEINNPSAGAWHAAYDPQFTATGAPVLTNAGSTLVNNPFYHVAGIQTSQSTYTSSNVGAYGLLRPNPILGNLTETRGTGISRYYALQNKVERRFQNGFSLLSAFTWGKSLTANSFYSNQVAGAIINHTLDPADTKFHYVLTPVYELPFGRGKPFGNHVNRLLDEAIGGFTLSGSYNFQSGTPVTLPTQTAFYQGGNPSLGTNKSGSKWFDTTKFAPFPTSSTTRDQLASYPAWTGVGGLPGAGWVPTPNAPGYAKINNGVYGDFATYTSYNQNVFGNIRNPYTTTFTVGLRKRFAVTESTRLELGMDVFNALNHPIFGNIDTNPNDAYFGAISGGPPSKWVQVNSPRTIQLRGKFNF